MLVIFVQRDEGTATLEGFSGNEGEDFYEK